MANSKRKCTGCKSRFPADQMKSLPAGHFHSIECAIAYANKAKEKQAKRQAATQKKIDKEKRKATKIKKQALKTIGQLAKEAQTSINKYIRFRDYGKPCISCGSLPKQKYGGTMDAGHYRSRGAASHLRFNLLNIHGQCVKCNRYKSGNAVDYRLNLIVKIGLDNVEALENNNKPRSFSRDYLERLKKIFNKRARFYEKRIKNKL